MSPWMYRLRWYILVRSKRSVTAGSFHNSTKSLLSIIILLAISLAGFIFLRSVWQVFMDGFLVSTPWIPGNQAGTYYWNSIMFAFKSTILTGLVILLAVFFLGLQFSKFFRRQQ